MKKIGLGLVFVMMVGTAAWAADPPPAAAKAPPAAAPVAPPAPPPMPGKPAAEMDALKAGGLTAKCDGKMTGPDGKEIAYKSGWTGKMVLGGNWMEIDYKRSKVGPIPEFEGHAAMGWDAASKKYLMMGPDSYGGYINLASADGLTYEGTGTMMGQAAPMKFVFAKDAKGKITSLTGFAGGKQIFQDTCK
jgi:hypothetical protein